MLIGRKRQAVEVDLGRAVDGGVLQVDPVDAGAAHELDLRGWSARRCNDRKGVISGIAEQLNRFHIRGDFRRCAIDGERASGAVDAQRNLVTPFRCINDEIHAAKLSPVLQRLDVKRARPRGTQGMPGS